MFNFIYSEFTTPDWLVKTSLIDIDHRIRDLIGLFPADSIDSHGQPFWSGPKRCPDPIQFNPQDSTHLMFLMSCGNLIAFNLGIT
jgi:ubiquitin-activating enzyme E1